MQPWIQKASCPVYVPPWSIWSIGRATRPWKQNLISLHKKKKKYKTEIYLTCNKTASRPAQTPPPRLPSRSAGVGSRPLPGRPNGWFPAQETWTHLCPGEEVRWQQVHRIKPLPRREKNLLKDRGGQEAILVQKGGWTAKQEAVAHPRPARPSGQTQPAVPKGTEPVAFLIPLLFPALLPSLVSVTYLISIYIDYISFYIYTYHLFFFILLSSS